ncbi:MAG: hypothetical protein MAGBODY4_00137 [Candidatus Marinimicrobia bacterium]|nr:hypothetical protein [Candidatus Neomarinimicrobiota bacterium]
MIRSGFKGMITMIAGMAFVCLFAIQLNAQEDHSYLAQKVMLENTLRERISDGLSKVLEGEKFVVDVQAEIEFRPSQRTETVYRPKKQASESADRGSATSAPGRESQPQQREGATTEQPSGPSGVGMILPGIPSDVEFEGQRPQQQLTTAEEATPEKEQTDSDTVSTTQTQSGAEIVSHSVAQSNIALPKIKRLNISVILEDGISPELLENARQVVKVASHFDRSRGDMLSMMTASFKKAPTKDGELDEEAILLQNIANKVEEIERKQNEAETRRVLEEQRQREQMLLRRDSLRLQQLTQELEDLRTQLHTQQLQSAERETTEARATELQGQREEIQSTIAELRENIASRDSALATLKSGIGINLWYVVLALVILALIIGGIVWYVVRAQRKESSRQEERLREQLLEHQRMTEEKEKSTKKEQPSQPRNTAAEKKEVQSVRQSVVSMSVGKPDAASDILKNWLTEEENYIPEEPEEPPTEEMS